MVEKEKSEEVKTEEDGNEEVKIEKKNILQKSLKITFKLNSRRIAQKQHIQLLLGKL